MVTAMILAGGVGSRVGAERPKQFIEVCGKPIIEYTIENYENHPEVDAIMVVCHSQWIEYLKKVIKENGVKKVRWVVEGGDSFQRSVINGINFFQKVLKKNDVIILQYAAAPFTDADIITDSIKVCKQHKVAVSCIPCYQLLGSNDKNATSEKWIDRDKIIQIACPQTFEFNYLIDLYEEAKKKGIVDTAEPHTTSLMYALGKKIYLSYGKQSNIKITTREDVEFFGHYLRGKDI